MCILSRLLGQYRDGFDFQSVFGPRRWYTEQTHGYVLNTTLAVADSSVAAATRTPAAAHLMLRRSPYLRELSEVAAGRLQPTPRFFECWAFVEQPPLSNAGHEQLKCAIKQ